MRSRFVVLTEILSTSASIIPRLQYLVTRRPSIVTAMTLYLLQFIKQFFQSGKHWRDFCLIKFDFIKTYSVSAPILVILKKTTDNTMSGFVKTKCQHCPIFAIIVHCYFNIFAKLNIVSIIQVQIELIYIAYS